MKKFFAICVALVLCVAAFAQEPEKSDDIIRGPYEKNALLDNCFLGGGLGFNFPLNNVLSGNLDFGFGFPAGYVYGGKWLHPTYGARIGLLAGNGGHFNGGKNFTYFALPVDFLLNASNLFWGYKYGRLYNFIPYVSLAPLFGGNGVSFGFGGGVQNTFRLNDYWNAVVDLRSILGGGKVGYDEGGFLFYNTLTFGVQFNFPKNTFTRAADASAADAAAATAAATPDTVVVTKVDTVVVKAAPDTVVVKAAPDTVVVEAPKDTVVVTKVDTVVVKEPVSAVDVAPEEVSKAISELRHIRFPSGKPVLDANAKANLDIVADWLKSDSSIKLEIAGHTDSTGNPNYNMKLSERRAAVVVDYLKSRGVSDSQLYAKGYGPNKPIADNSTEEGREANRRVEFMVL